MGHKGRDGEGWDDAFLAAIGLSELAENNHAAIGAQLAPPGTDCSALLRQAADDLGLHADGARRPA